MSNERKQRMLEYKQRVVTGAVYTITNTANGRILLDYTADFPGLCNRFSFAQKNATAMSLKLQKDWEAHGGGCFILEAVETLEKKPDQSDGDFRSDLRLLLGLWREKLSGADLY